MAIDTFIKISTIKGESTDDKHKDEIEVLVWNWGVETTVVQSGGGGARAGRANLREFTFRHHIDRASAAFMKACATGQHIPDATLTARKAGRTVRDYLVIKMTDVLVTSVLDATSDADPVPMEAVTLRYGKIEYSYTPQKADGSPDAPVEFKFDVNANRPF